MLLLPLLLSLPLSLQVLDAPKLVDDFYLNLLSWSCQNVLAVGLAAEVYMWNGFTSKVEKLADFTEPVGALGWSDRGAHLAVGGVSGYLGIYDVATGKEVRSLKGHVGRVGAVTFAGHLLASGGRDKCVYIRDVRSSRDFEVRLSDHVQVRPRFLCRFVFCGAAVRVSQPASATA